MLAAGSEGETVSCEDSDDDDDDPRYVNESEEERKARKESIRRQREKQMLLDQMDGVPSNSLSSSGLSGKKKTTIFDLESAF